VPRAMTQVYRVDPEHVDRRVIEEVAGILKRGGLVAFPTETVYGLGALITIEEAVERVYRVKGRPMDNPLIVHVDSVDMFLELADNPPETVIKLAERLWPGPFTIVWWKRKGVVPDVVTAGLPKVAIRSPAHPVALELIRACGVAIAAPSANRAGKPSPTTAQHVLADLNGLIDAVVDAGETLYGVESTIIDFTVNPPRLLRPGALPVEEIERLLGEKIEVPDYARGLREADSAVAPGMKYKHYAPEAKLFIVETDDYSRNLPRVVERVREIALSWRERGVRVAVICSAETCSMYSDLGVPLFEIGSRSNMFSVARNLFKTLRKLDEAGVELAVVEGFEERGLGLAVMNRLRKASGLNIVRV